MQVEIVQFPETKAAYIEHRGSPALEHQTVPEPIAGRSYSGKFMVRVPPNVHRKLAVQAAESGVSLNRIASSKLSQ
ncbi:MAG: toxin-antitoxin system HicB family antitoxin [Desulfobacterales bacterium]